MPIDTGTGENSLLGNKKGGACRDGQGQLRGHRTSMARRQTCSDMSEGRGLKGYYLFNCVARAAALADLGQVMLFGKFLHMHLDGVAIGAR